MTKEIVLFISPIIYGVLYNASVTISQQLKIFFVMNLICHIYSNKCICGVPYKYVSFRVYIFISNQFYHLADAFIHTDLQIREHFV